MYKKAVQWLTVLQNETPSALGIFWNYYLPRGLVRLFRIPTFDIFYGIGIAALVLSVIPSGKIRDFLVQALLDIWIKNVGGMSAAKLDNIISNFKPEWTIYVLTFMILWLLIALLWARPKQLFFQEIRNAGIAIIRGPGARLSFLNRLQLNGANSLGLGPSAKLLPWYIENQENPLLREKMSTLLINRKKFGLLIAGKATAGKTRAAMELIFEMKPAMVFIWHKSVDEKNLNFKQRWQVSSIIFVDDVNLSEKSAGNPLPGSLESLLIHCPKMVLLGTIRTERLPKDLRKLDYVEIKGMTVVNQEIQKLAEEVAKAESEALGSPITSKEVLDRFNGHPAGLVAGIDAMRDLFTRLEDEARAFLQGAKILHEMGIKELTLDRLWSAASVICQREIPAVKKQPALEKVEKEGFINPLKPEEQSINIYEAYLDNVIISPLDYDKIEEKIQQEWLKLKDWKVLFEYGSYLADFEKFLYWKNPHLQLERVIKSYQNALTLLSPLQNKQEYITSNINLGIAFIGMSSYEQPIDNVKLCISSFDTALEFAPKEKDPYNYALCQRNLGGAYLLLAEYHDLKANMEKALRHFEEALLIFSPNQYPIEYAISKVAISSFYFLLASYRDPTENLDKAILALNDAMNYFDAEKETLRYTTTKEAIANNYTLLAKYKDPLINLNKAFNALKETQSFFTSEKTPLGYSIQQADLGWAYQIKAIYLSPKENLQNAIHAYDESLRFLNSQQDPFDFAEIQRSKEDVYVSLANHEDSADVIRSAIHEYNKILKVLIPEFFPNDYYITQQSLGNAYRNLSKYENQKDNFNNALRAYQEALNFFIPEMYPILYAEIQDNLGKAYLYYSDQEDKKVNLEKAIGFFREALKYLNPNNDPFDYAKVKYDMGWTFYGLANCEKEKRQIRDDLNDAIMAFDEALQVISPELQQGEFKDLTFRRNIASKKLQETAITDN